MSSMRFHTCTGSLVILSNSNQSARRSHPRHEFNNGLVMSSEPLRDNEIFEVRIDKKVPSWSGSIEIGVTSTNPTSLAFPSSATDLREGSWVMSGTSILQDGRSVIDEYGDDLDQLAEGDRVGVMRTSSGMLRFYINGIDQGVIAAAYLPSTVYAVVDLYGKCVQVSIIDSSNNLAPFNHLSIEDCLRFHERCGAMVKLSNDNYTAERVKPAYMFNNGVVLTNRPLKDNEMFEIILHELVYSWSRYIDFGVTIQTPDGQIFPETLHYKDPGNYKITEPKSDVLRPDKSKEVVDRLGVMRKTNGDLHFFYNGIEQGVAAQNVPPVIYGFVELHSTPAKVTFAGSGSHISNTPPNRIPTALSLNLSPTENYCNIYNEEELLFHPRCGDHVAVVNGGRTAIRPNCQDDFNNAVVITERPLHCEEFFEVVLEHIVTKWAGSIEIGVTTHCAEDFDFPPTMTNVRSGTWMMTGNGIMYNGTTVIDEYGCNLDKLKTGDRVGLKVTEDRKLHFYVNGIDQGLAAHNIPEKVYGVIDLYGQAAKASIVHNSETTSSNAEAATSSNSHNIPGSSSSNSAAVPKFSSSKSRKVYPKRANDTTIKYIQNSMKNFSFKPSPYGDPSFMFHAVHGQNIIFKDESTQATRTHDCQHGLVFSAKPIELEGCFEVHVLTVDVVWAGKLRIGLTTYQPTPKQWLPATFMDLKNDCKTWVLCNGHIYFNGEVQKWNYSYAYQNLWVGDKVGVKKDRDGNLSFTLNGCDLGVAAQHLPKNLYVVCDIFGGFECIKITKADFPPCPPVCDNLILKELEDIPLVFHKKCGKNIKISESNKVAKRIRGFDNGLVFTSRSLKPDEIFKIKIHSINNKWSSTVRIGITNQNPVDIENVPFTIFNMKSFTWFFCDNALHHNGQVMKKFETNLINLDVNQTIGVMVSSDGELHLIIDDVDLGPSMDGIFFPCYGIIDVYGQCVKVSFLDIETKEEKINEIDEINEAVGEKDEIEHDDVQYKKFVNLCKLYKNDCDFKTQCLVVRNLLCLPESYFLPDEIICYCDLCFQQKLNLQLADDEFPKEHKQLKGWCYMGVKVYKKPAECNIENWHLAYQGMKPFKARRILDAGQLLPPGKLRLKIIRTNASEEETLISNTITFSPSLEYASLSEFSPTEERKWGKAKITFKIAFQALVHPGCYNVRSPTLDRKLLNDTQVKSHDLEWYTKEEGSTMLRALLIKIINFDPGPP